MTRSWNHTLTPYTAEEASNLPDWWHCSWPRCKKPATHRATYDYVTGRLGRVTALQRELCDEHAERFAEKHGLLSRAENSHSGPGS